MQMQKLGWFFIAAYCVDALFSLAATFFPVLETPCNFYSMLMILFGVVVLIFTCMGSLRPKRVFFVMLGFNGLSLVFGIFLGVMLLIEYGPEAQNQTVNIAFYRETFPWYWSAHWIFMMLWLAVCAYGVTAYALFMKKITPPPL
jgi:hypothetical protein